MIRPLSAMMVVLAAAICLQCGQDETVVRQETDCAKYYGALTPIEDRYERALSRYVQGNWVGALDVLNTIESELLLDDDQPSLALVLNLKSLIYANQSRWQDSFRAINRSLDINETISSTLALAVNLETRASLYLLRYRQNQAANPDLETIELAEGEELLVEAQPDTQERDPLQSFTQGALLAQARNGYEDAIDAYSDCSDETGRSNGFAGLGVVLFEQGDLDNAIAMFRVAREINRRLGDPFATADINRELARTFMMMNDTEKAMRSYQLAFDLDRSVDNLAGQIESLAGMAAIKESDGDLAGARDFYLQAAELAANATDLTLDDLRQSRVLIEDLIAILRASDDTPENQAEIYSWERQLQSVVRRIRDFMEVPPPADGVTLILSEPQESQ